MKRVKLLVNMGKFKAGWGIEVSDGVALAWAKEGRAIIGAPDQPLKKGNLEFYNNCQPLTPAEIAAKTAATKIVKPPKVEAEETANKQTL